MKQWIIRTVSEVNDLIYNNNYRNDDLESTIGTWMDVGKRKKTRTIFHELVNIICVIIIVLLPRSYGSQGWTGKIF